MPRGGKQLACLAAAIALVSQVSANECKPTWQQEFDTPLDEGVWNTVEGDGCDIDLCGWGNQEKQYYHADALEVTDGVLKITASQDEAGQILSGKITTAGHFSQKFGRFEARMKLPAGRGLWPAFWMMPEGQQKPWPHEGEIDILEWTGNEPHRIIGAVHFGDGWPNNVHYSEELLTPAVWSGDYHVYGVEWSPQSIRWTVDGRVHGEANADNIAPWNWVFDDLPFYFILNMAVGGTLGGEVVMADLPATLEVDWVRVYDGHCD